MNKQTWNAGQYKNHASFVPALGAPVLQLLNPQPNECILDIGCGDGSLTDKISQVGAEVIGIDSSESMILSARQRGLNAVLMNGAAITYEHMFDAVFTNAALHWISDYDSVINGVWNALKDGGRFVGEFGGRGNIGILIAAMEEIIVRHPEMGKFHNPWYFPSDAEYRVRLEKCGFIVSYIELIPRPTPLETGVKEWLKIFADHVISGMQAELVDRFLTETEELVRPKLYTEDKGWQADYVRIRFSAVKV